MRLTCAAGSVAGALLCTPVLVLVYVSLQRMHCICGCRADLPICAVVQSRCVRMKRGILRTPSSAATSTPAPAPHHRQVIPG